MKRIITALCVTALAVAALSGCFHKVTTDTVCVLRCMVQTSSTDKTYTPADNVEVFGFFADSTYWTVKSYADALAHTITNSKDTQEQRNIPDVVGETFTLPADKTDSSVPVTAAYYSLALRRTPVMIVAVDKTNRMFAYMFRYLDADNLPYTYVTLIFQPWQKAAYKQGSKEGYLWQVFPPDYDSAAQTTAK